jgi:hypothetical protein
VLRLGPGIERNRDASNGVGRLRRSFQELREVNHKSYRPDDYENDNQPPGADPFHR